jgi:pilus assembly protein CpaB
MGKPANTRVRALIFLTIAGIAAIAAGVVVVQLYQDYKVKLEGLNQDVVTEFYIVASSELHQGIEITENDLFAVEIPPRYLFKDGGSDSNLFKHHEAVVGRMPRERILANEFIRKERLADKQQGVGLNAIIPRGMRAIAVQVEGGKAISGFLKPWNYVDVMVTFSPEDGVGAETHYLQQAVIVLGVAANFRKAGERKEGEEEPRWRKRQRARAANTVTLAVSPSQAERIAHAQALGALTLTLRNNNDIQRENDLEGIDEADMFGQEPPAVFTPAPVEAERGDESRIGVQTSRDN